MPDETEKLVEVPVVEEPPPPPKRPRRTYEQAAKNYGKPSFPGVVALDPKYTNTKTTLNVVQYTNGYLTGIKLTGGKRVETKEMSLGDAYRFEVDLIRRARSRLTRDKPELPK